MGAAMPLIMSAYVGIADAAVDAATEAVAGRTEPHVFQLLGEMLNAHTTAADVVARCSPTPTTCSSPTPTSTRAAP